MRVGLKEYASLEAALLANDDLSTFQKYPEINVERLKIQLPMFKLQYNDCSTYCAHCGSRSEINFQ